MTGPTAESGGAATARPVTGEPGVDEALAGLDDLDRRPVGEHYERLSRAHEALHEVLQSPPPGAGTDDERADRERG